MAKIFLDRMTLRNSLKAGLRSCLVVTSSGLANFAMPGIISYSSTKVLVSRFCEATAEEVRSKNIDVMSYEANAITTKLSDGMSTNLKIDMTNGSLTTVTAVAHCFTKIGYETRSSGHWLHEL
jgi:short-subunit dehydrogenase